MLEDKQTIGLVHGAIDPNSGGNRSVVSKGQSSTVAEIKKLGKQLAETKEENKKYEEKIRNLDEEIRKIEKETRRLEEQKRELNDELREIQERNNCYGIPL